MKKRSLEEILTYPIELNSFNREQWVDLLNELYGDPNYRPDEVYKMNEIFRNTSLNLSASKFQRGRIYSFKYQYLNEDKKDYIDTNPLIFVLGEIKEQNKFKIKGINFNFLPYQVKNEFMEIYFKIFHRILEQDVLKIEEENLYLYKYTQKDIDFLINVVKDFFPNIFNAIRYWEYEKIHGQSVDFISPEYYNIISNYEGYKKSIKGINWKVLQTNILN